MRYGLSAARCLRLPRVFNGFCIFRRPLSVFWAAVYLRPCCFKLLSADHTVHGQQAVRAHPALLHPKLNRAASCRLFVKQRLQLCPVQTVFFHQGLRKQIHLVAFFLQQRDCPLQLPGDYRLRRIVHLLGQRSIP